MSSNIFRKCKQKKLSMIGKSGEFFLLSFIYRFKLILFVTQKGNVFNSTNAIKFKRY